MLVILLAGIAQSLLSIRVVNTPDAGRNAYYVSNRAPLQANAFNRLPVGSIVPKGWVRKQLELEANGFTGHLAEISEWLNPKNNAWLSPTGAGIHGWEEVPYWLKGFGDLGYVLNDQRIKKEAKVWLDAMLASQRPNGYFGPESNLTANSGHPDVWPNMPMLNAIESYYEVSSDPHVLPFLKRYFEWENAQPDDAFLLSYWERHRTGDNMAAVYWLYNRTGEPFLLDLVRKLHRRQKDWVSGVANWHGVNFAQAFREPAEYGLLDQDPKFKAATERDYEKMRRLYGQVPGGMYGADENARPGYSDPRQAAETCAMVEMMYSDEMLLGETGDPRWAERCEDVAFNSLPASMTADERALHYLTAPNMALADARSKAPGLENSGPMLLFNPHDHRCCQHNVAMGWPYYAESLWLTGAHNGLAALLYAPSMVTAKVGDGTPVRITESTTYPFEETVRFKFETAKPNRFPLTLRLPSWCSRPELTLNGQTFSLPKSGAYAILERTWRNGDRLVVRFPMHLNIHAWPENKNAVSVERGPLTYSLKINEAYKKSGGTAAWPAFEVDPMSNWNYGLTSGQLTHPESIRVIQRPFPADGQPFAPGKAPIELVAEGKRIPQWRLDSHGLTNVLQPSPALVSGPAEKIELAPMGACRLRISEFPVVTAAKGTKAWKEPVATISARFSMPENGDTVDALSDGILPKKGSGDQTIPRFTWWDHRGGTEWVEYDFPKTRSVGGSGVYWFDDRRSGGRCRIPASWQLSAWVDGKWQSIKADYGVAIDRLNEVRFTPVRTTKLRLTAKFQPEFSSGILEWTVKPR